MKTLFKNCLVFVLSLIVCFSVVGCSSANKENDSATEANSNTDQANSNETDNEEKYSDEIKSQVGALQGKSLSEALEVLDNLNVKYGIYNNDYSHDYADECKSWNKETKDGWIIKSVAKPSFTDRFMLQITTRDEAASGVSSNSSGEKLDATVALTAMEQRGKKDYPYGFKIVDKILGNNVEKQLDENTWLLKYSCEITNAYNSTTKMTCEAKITGSNDNPQVVEFSIY